MTKPVFVSYVRCQLSKKRQALCCARRSAYTMRREDWFCCAGVQRKRNCDFGDGWNGTCRFPSHTAFYRLCYILPEKTFFGCDVLDYYNFIEFRSLEASYSKQPRYITPVYWVKYYHFSSRDKTSEPRNLCCAEHVPRITVAISVGAPTKVVEMCLHVACFGEADGQRTTRILYQTCKQGLSTVARPLTLRVNQRELK